MTNIKWTIVNSIGLVVAEVVVEADDVAQARRDGDTGSDADIALGIYEQRYESVLASAGYTAEDAAAGGFYSIQETK